MLQAIKVDGIRKPIYIILTAALILCALNNFSIYRIFGVDSSPYEVSGIGSEDVRAEDYIVWSGTKIITDDYQVDQKKILVRAGTVVKIGSGAEITINSAMICQGTVEEPIIFTKYSESNWQGLKIFQTSTNVSYFNNTILSFAKLGLKANRSSVLLTNSSFSNCLKDMELEESSFISALNCTIDKEKVDILDQQSRLSINWYLDIFFESQNIPVNGIPLAITNINGVPVGQSPDLISDSEGKISKIIVTEEILKMNDQEIKTTHKIEYPHPIGEGKSIHYVYMDKSMQLRLPLEYYASPSSVSGRVSRESIRSITKDLMNFPNRYRNTTSHKEVENYLVQRFSELFGENVDTFTFYVNGTAYTNIICTSEGINPVSDEEYIILAHYDTESLAYKGADDDASGMAVLLESARLLSSYDFNATIRFVAVDGGSNGSGRIGSNEYARNLNLSGSNIGAVITLDRIGYGGAQGDVCGIWKNQLSNSIVDNLTDVNIRQNIDLSIRQVDGRMEGQDDYYSFWKYNLPAVGLSESDSLDIEDWWPSNWPEEDNNYSRLDFDYMSKFSRLVSCTMFEYAGIKKYLPTVPSIISANATHRLKPTLRWAPSFDFQGQNVAYEITIQDRNGSYLLSSEIIQDNEFTFQEEGFFGHVYYINVTAVNSKNVRSPNSTLELHLINNPPVFSAMENKTTYQGVPLDFVVNATDIDRPVDILYFQLLPTGHSNLELNRTTGRFQWTPNNTAVGDHFFTFLVFDGNGGEDTIELKITVKNVNDPPQIITQLDRIYIEEDTPEKLYFNLSSIFWDPDLGIDENELLNYTFFGNRSIIFNIENNNSVHISMKKNYFGQENITLIATDNYNASTSIYFSVNVTPVNDLPKIEYNKYIVVSEGEMLSIDPKITDPDNKNISVSYSGATTTSWWQTGYLDNGTHDVFITASDGEGNVTHTLKVIVSNVPVGPSIFLFVPKLIEPGEYVTFDANSSFDPDGNIVRYDWDFGDGTKITTNTSRVQHKYNEKGTYAVTLTIYDDDDKGNSTTLNVEVEYEPNTKNILCSISILLAIVAVGAVLLSRIGRKEMRAIKNEGMGLGSRTEKKGRK